MERMELRVDGEGFRALAEGPPGGPTVLLLHGFPDLPLSWAPLMRRLAARGYRCVAPWMRGYPPSTTEGPFHLDRLVSDALGLLEALSPRRAAFLIGHDWGAAATWRAAERGGPRLAAAVALSVPHPRTFARAALSSPAQLWRSRYMIALQGRSIDRRGIERLWRRWSPGLEPPLGHLEEVARAIREGRGAPVEYYRAARRSLWRLLRRRPAGGAPLLYLHGRDDGCIGPRAARLEAGRGGRASRVEVLEGAGHFLPLEAPGRVASRALGFFEAHGGRPAGEGGPRGGPPGPAGADAGSSRGC